MDDVPPTLEALPTDILNLFVVLMPSAYVTLGMVCHTLCEKVRGRLPLPVAWNLIYVESPESAAAYQKRSVGNAASMLSCAFKHHALVLIQWCHKHGASLNRPQYLTAAVEAGPCDALVQWCLQPSPMSPTICASAAIVAALEKHNDFPLMQKLVDYGVTTKDTISRLCHAAAKSNNVPALRWIFASHPERGSWWWRMAEPVCEEAGNHGSMEASVWLISEARSSPDEDRAYCFLQRVLLGSARAGLLVFMEKLLDHFGGTRFSISKYVSEKASNIVDPNHCLFNIILGAIMGQHVDVLDWVWQRADPLVLQPLLRDMFQPDHAIKRGRLSAHACLIDCEPADHLPALLEWFHRHGTLLGPAIVCYAIGHRNSQALQCLRDLYGDDVWLPFAQRITVSHEWMDEWEWRSCFRGKTKDSPYLDWMQNNGFVFTDATYLHVCMSEACKLNDRERMLDLLRPRVRMSSTTMDAIARFNETTRARWGVIHYV